MHDYASTIAIYHGDGRPSADCNVPLLPGHTWVGPGGGYFSHQCYVRGDGVRAGARTLQPYLLLNSAHSADCGLRSSSLTRCKAEIIMTIPARSSKLLPHTRSAAIGVSSCSHVMVEPTSSPRSAAWSASCAPTSTSMSLILITFLRSSGSSIWGGLEPITPGTEPFSPWTTTRCERRVWSNQPPRVVKRRKPSSSIYLTIKPISSICAAIITLGPSPLLTPMTLPMVSTFTSSTRGASSSATNLEISSSWPETPCASVKVASNRCSSSIIACSSLGCSLSLVGFVNDNSN